MSKLNNIGIYDKKTGEEIDVIILENIIKDDKKQKIKNLELKFNNNTIKKIELEELMQYKYNKKDIYILYDKFFKVNMSKKKPEDLSFSEYGKFFEMLNYISYHNTLVHKNGKIIKRSDLQNYLEFKNMRGFNSFIRKLSKLKMLGEANIGGINFLLINPAYAQRKMRLNSTIFNLFKNDLIEFLDKYQIKYLEMEEADMDIDSVISVTEK